MSAGDFLRDSPIYQEVLAEGFKKGLEKGRREGVIEVLRQTLLDIIFERFPEIIILVKKASDSIDDSYILRRLVVKMGTLPTVEEAKRLLLALSQDENDN